MQLSKHHRHCFVFLSITLKNNNIPDVLIQLITTYAETWFWPCNVHTDSIISMNDYSIKKAQSLNVKITLQGTLVKYVGDRYPVLVVRLHVPQSIELVHHYFCIRANRDDNCDDIFINQHNKQKQTKEIKVYSKYNPGESDIHTTTQFFVDTTSMFNEQTTVHLQSYIKTYKLKPDKNNYVCFSDKALYYQMISNRPIQIQGSIMYSIFRRDNCQIFIDWDTIICSA